MQEERREFERFPYPDASSIIKTRIVWASSGTFNEQDVRFIDVSRAGLGIVTGNEFNVGDAVKLEVSLAETEAITLVAVVCNRRTIKADEQDSFQQDPSQQRSPPQRLFRYGMYFEYDAEQGDPHCESVLEHLEEEVKRLHFQPV